MRRLATALLPVLLGSCGSIGDPLPPALNIPEPVEDLRVVQRGDMIIADFALPRMTTEGLVLDELSRVELRYGPSGESEFNVERWSESAKAFEPPVTTPGPVHVELPVAGWVDQELVFAARAYGPTGRPGDWSNTVVRRIVAPLSPPEGLKPEPAAEGVLISWNPVNRQEVAYNVYRGADGEAGMTLLARTEKNQWMDKTAEYGKTYRYAVQTIIDSGAIQAESDLSRPAAITPRDTFPPAVPAGLTALAATGSVELTWDRNTEPDLAGYYVYRAAEGEPFRRVSGLLEIPAFSDGKIEPGKRYRYAVSATDRDGNESQRSPVIDIQAP